MDLYKVIPEENYQIDISTLSRLSKSEDELYLNLQQYIHNTPV